eukprot:Skav222851  [mRNA]  locus=scaffold850:324926:331079:- [translate_table: standard]
MRAILQTHSSLQGDLILTFDIEEQKETTTSSAPATEPAPATEDLGTEEPERVETPETSDTRRLACQQAKIEAGDEESFIARETATSSAPATEPTPATEDLRSEEPERVETPEKTSVTRHPRYLTVVNPVVTVIDCATKYGENLLIDARSSMSPGPPSRAAQFLGLGVGPPAAGPCAVCAQRRALRLRAVGVGSCDDGRVAVDPEPLGMQLALVGGWVGGWCSGEAPGVGGRVQGSQPLMTV